jgi:hypothetical protein
MENKQLAPFYEFIQTGKLPPTTRTTVKQDYAQFVSSFLVDKPKPYTVNNPVESWSIAPAEIQVGDMIAPRFNEATPTHLRKRETAEQVLGMDRAVFETTRTARFGRPRRTTVVHTTERVRRT